MNQLPGGLGLSAAGGRGAESKGGHRRGCSAEGGKDEEEEEEEEEEERGRGSEGY